MFRTLRWRLTLWFVMLSLLVYSALSLVGMMVFHNGLTSALDDELKQLAQELMQNVDYDQDGNSLQLRAWPTKGHHQHPIKLLASIELFDRKKHLVQALGQEGIDRYISGVSEITAKEYSKRSLSEPIYSGDGKLIGYLQIQLTTKLRDNAIRQYGETMSIIAPMMVLGLGIFGYFFSGKAAQPIEETFQVLRQFLSDAGHELGTPLAIIQAATENLQEQLEGTPHEGRLNIISRTTDRMSRLVQDLTLLAKIDVRSSQPKQNTTVSLERILRSCVEEFEDRFKEKKIELLVTEIQPITVFGDQDALHRLLTNLLENAWRYTDENGKVTVSLKGAGRTARLNIEDSGIGIPPESLPHLFDRFYRVDKSRARSAGGFGLGLSIVKAIAENHRGYVEVASELGKGSRFSVFIPTT